MVDLRVNARPALLLTTLASVAVGFALFAVLLGTSAYVQAPRASGYGFGSSILVSGLCLLPSGLSMLLLSLACHEMVRVKTVPPAVGSADELE